MSGLVSSAGALPTALLGHPDYYPRFRFQPGAEHGLSHGFDGIPQEVFFVNLLDRSVVQSIAGGTAIYRPEFGPQRDNTDHKGAPKRE